MNTKTFVTLFLAVIVLCSCSHVHHGSNAISFSVSGDITDNQFEFYAFHNDDDGNLELCFHDLALREDSDGIWTFSGDNKHNWPVEKKVMFYAYTPCDGVKNVTSSNATPLLLEYTTNPDFAKQGDLLIAICEASEEDGTAHMEFKHALTRLSFVWNAQENTNTETKYKLRKLTVWAKQSGIMTIAANDSMPRWTLITENGDFRFLVYECPDYDEPESLRRYQNPDEELLLTTNSLYLAPGTAVAADVEYSVWRNDEYEGTLSASDIILGGRENSAAFIEWNTHYTYILSPNDEGNPLVKVKMKVEEWNNGTVHPESH